MAWANDSAGRGWTPIFGGSSASADEGGERQFGEAQPLVEVGHRGQHGGRIQVAQRARRSGRTRIGVYAAAMA